MKRSKLLLIIGLLFFFWPVLRAQLSVAQIFGNDMVLQREHPIRIWGQALAKTRIRVSLNNVSTEVRADKEGKWEATLAAMPAGGPYEIEIASKQENIVLKNVLIGDIWLCSGQSNMEWTVFDANNAAAEMATANDDGIRHFGVPKSYATEPSDELAGGGWKTTNPENVGSFTAVGYFFARELRKHTDVPIGLLHTSWGGSRIEPWMSKETLAKGSETDGLEMAMKKAREAQESAMAALQAKHPGLTTEDQGSSKGEYLWAKAILDEKNWTSIHVPALWETQGYDQFDGIAWYRTSFTLSEAEAQQGAVLHLGQIDDSDISWVNGQEVGGMQMAYNKQRIYQVDAEILQAGENTIAVRVEDTGGGGGIAGENADIRIVTATQSIDLSGSWKFRPGAYLDKGSALVNANQLPTLLYNKMIYPILRFPIKGALWYQGESNANSEIEAMVYRQLFQDMITSWRAAWKVGDFPFLYVQLANFMAAKAQPGDSNWALLRESQSAALSLPATGEAVIIDIGEAEDIHPRNKQDVGLRLSLAARKIAYGEDLVYSGPTLKNYEISEGKVTLRFDTYGSHLACDNPYGYVRAFAVAGADQQYVWAKAILSGDEIIVWSEEVPQPLYVRYAWADNPADANLINAEGLPASPFQIAPRVKE